MRYLAIGLAAFAIVACRTHAGDPCDPPCTEDDRLAFAQCVAAGMPAYGDDAACPAGNRMCCALNQHCLGELDDQTVTTDGICPDPETVTIEYCGSACDAVDEGDFAECVATNGFEMCPSGDVERCCAETIGCLGMLGSYLVVSSADCCDDDTDCPLGQYCDLDYGECEDPSDDCGDYFVDEASGEECDAGPDGDVAVPCDYGESACLRCTSECRHVEGETQYCGDGVIDSSHETCDPPGPICTSACQDLPRSACGDRVMNFDETAVDCGGPSCTPCDPGQACLRDRDCRVITTFCMYEAVCSTDGVCIEVDACDDGDPCTRDYCQAATGGVCVGDVIDDDFDDVGPGPLCGGDCDDTNPYVFPGSTFTNACDGIDDDCDGDMDESPTSCP